MAYFLLLNGFLILPGLNCNNTNEINTISKHKTIIVVSLKLSPVAPDDPISGDDTNIVISS